MLKIKLKKKTTKEKPKKAIKGKGLKIVDVDAFAGDYKPASESDNDDVEDQPQIASVVDERPMEVQVMESFNKGKWKRIEDNETSAENQNLAPKVTEDPNDISPPRRRDRSESPNSYSRRCDPGDMSPPRRKRSESPRSRRRKDGRPDSRERQRNRHNSNDMSPPRKKNDASPPRRSDRRENPNSRRRDSDDDDMSPPRRKRSESPRSRRRKDSRERQRNRHNSNDMSPPRKRNDASPPRRRDRRENPNSRRRDSDDMSPPRRKRSESPRFRRGKDGRPDSRERQRNRHSSNDVSPPRQRNKRSPTPPRQNRRRDSDGASPPRRRDVPFTRNSDRRRDRNVAVPEVLDTSDSAEVKTTLDGKKAGLQKASALRDEMLEYRQRENEMFELLPDDVTGRNAKAVTRDRRTKEDISKEMEKEKKEAERKEQYNKWGKGLKQVEEQEERVRAALHEMSKPLARNKDDKDLDDHLKNIDRDGDPMLEYLAAKRRKAKGGPEKPKYNGPPPPPNRFNIPPGYRWDGVDRSNGYEKEWFSRINAKKALQEEAYKWSVEDL